MSRNKRKTSKTEKQIEEDIEFAINVSAIGGFDRPSDEAIQIMHSFLNGEMD